MFTRNTGRLQRIKLPMLIVGLFSLVIVPPKTQCIIIMNLKFAFSICIWMSPTKTRSFQIFLLWNLKRSTTHSFWTLGHFFLHPVHTDVCKGLKELQFNFDEFLNDFHFFFKLSGARRKDYPSLEEVTNVAAEYTKKHRSTRWLSRKYKCIPLFKQPPNLKEYFFTFLSKIKDWPVKKV